jgi:phytoene desaturase
MAHPLPRTSGADAIVIGAGLGGLAAAMRLGAKGYRVTVVDRLDMPGGRGSSITQSGHRFDLGPTIVTVPQGLRELWAVCGRDFDRDVDLRALDPFYQIRWQDGSHFTARQSTDAMRAEVARLAPPTYLAMTGSCRTANAATGSGLRIWGGGRCTALPTC